jgi:thiol-disulfide isomerase/thioredoxin
MYSFHLSMNTPMNTTMNMHTFIMSCVVRASALLYIGAMLLASTSMLAASELAITPAMPKTGTAVSFRYKPDSTFTAAYSPTKPLHVFAYRFTEMTAQPNAIAVPLRYDATEAAWTGTLMIRPEDVFVLYKISNATATMDNKTFPKEDRNGGALWETYVSADGINPAQSSSLKAGFSWLGSLPAQCNRIVELPKALALMRRELVLYPNNRQAQVAELSLAYELRDIDEKTYRERVDRLLSTPYDSTKEHYVRAMMRFLNAQNKAADAEKLEEAFTAKYPQSELAQDYLYRKITSAQSEAFFMEKAQEFVATFPETYASYELQGFIAGALARNKKFDEALKFLEAQKYPSAVGYNELAKYWMWSDTSRQSGLEFAQKAVQLAYNPAPQHKPTFMTEIEWQKDSRLAIPITLNTLGAVLFQLKRDDEAMTQFKRALDETGGKGGPDTFMMMIKVLKNKNQTKEALAIAQQAFINLPKDTSITSAYRELFAAANPLAPTDLFAKERAKLLDSARTLRLQKMSAARLNLPPVQGTVTKVDGRRTTIAEHANGRVTIIAFWASWCTTCLDALSHLNILLEKYSGASSVAALAVNVWESREKDRMREARDLYRRRPYTQFPVAVDDRDELVKGFGVIGMPTFYFLDKFGRVQLKLTGFADAAPFIEYTEDAISLLQSDEFYKGQP